MKEEGLNLEATQSYINSSFKYFLPHEKHISRFCRMNVLIIVFRGVLRFVENDISVEVGPGEYYIQKYDTQQSGPIESDIPEYYYVHFNGEWSNDSTRLLRRGRFLIENLFPLCKELERAEKTYAPKIFKESIFYNILNVLYNENYQSKKAIITDEMALFLTMNLKNVPSLAEMSEKFFFSPNYIIRLFKEQKGTTPYGYLKKMRVEHAKSLLINTEMAIEDIAFECGFSDNSHLFKSFKEICGVSPREYKKIKSKDIT